MNPRNRVAYFLHPRSRSKAVSNARSGGRDLKSSAAYPRPFGHRVARLHCDFMAAESSNAPKWTSCDREAILQEGYKDSIKRQPTCPAPRSLVRLGSTRIWRPCGTCWSQPWRRRNSRLTLSSHLRSSPVSGFSSGSGTTIYETRS